MMIIIVLRLIVNDKQCDHYIMKYCETITRHETITMICDIIKWFITILIN